MAALYCVEGFFSRDRKADQSRCEDGWRWTQENPGRKHCCYFKQQKDLWLPWVILFYWYVKYLESLFCASLSNLWSKIWIKYIDVCGCKVTTWRNVLGMFVKQFGGVIHNVSLIVLVLGANWGFWNQRDDDSASRDTERVTTLHSFFVTCFKYTSFFSGVVWWRNGCLGFFSSNCNFYCFVYALFFYLPGRLNN